MKLENKKHRLKAIPRIATKLGVRQFAIISSALMAAIIIGWFGFLNFQNETAHGASTGDYRTATSGNWNIAGTWQRYNGSSWVAAATPTNADGVITIQNGHTVTINANVTADQVVVASGGQITLNSGITLTLNNGIGADLDVTGVFNNAGTVTINASATIAYQSGGKYQHNFTGSQGTIPAATWNAASTCEIMGYTGNNNAPSGLTQSFGNFTWNCPSQSSDIDLAGGLTTINGTFTVTSTGSKELRIASSATTLNIGGNYSQTGGDCAFSNSSSSNPIINISGNFGLSGGSCTLANGSGSLPVLNLFGNYSQSSGTFSVVDGSNSTGTVNVSGNWSHTGGTLTVGGNSSTSAQFIFNKSGSQTFTVSGNTVSGNVDFSVKSGSTLVMGNNILRGRDFNLSSGGGIQIGSAAGISSLPLIGNIQASGTRSYSTGAYYTYNGTAAQVTGDGLPSTVANLTINNGNDLTLNSTVSVSNILTFTNGNIITGLLNELISTNTSPAGVTGHSSSSYVVGVIRRSVSGTGTYDFPIGTASYYEMASVALSSATGFTNIVASFSNVDPLSILLPLSSVVVNAMPINRLLDYGYWTLTPNSSMTGGTYTVTLKERGYTASAASPAYCVLKRDNALSSWQSIGTHNYALQTESGGVVTSVRSGLTSFSDFAIGYGEYLQWENPVLISGVAGQVGAVYNFAGVSTGVDAWVEIVSLQNGAILSDIDYSTGGYSEAWQPFIIAKANATSSILWKITYKVIGTNTDTVMGNLSLSAIDVDGGNGMKEFVEASNIYSYSIDPSTSLSISYGARGYKALGGNTSISNIDTSFHHAIFQINHRNVTSFFYETGVVNTTSAGTRQFSLYFKYFMPGNVALPIKLLSFNAKYSKNEVGVQWSTATETNNDYFTIERSADGEHFEKVLTKKGAGTSHSVINYSAVDKYPLSGTSYYRLKQTDFNGEFSYSEVVTVNNHNNDKAAADLEIKSVAPSVFSDNFKINYTSSEEGEVLFVLANYAGQVITQERINTQQGLNSYQFNDEHNIPSGVYFAVLLFNGKKASYKVIKQ